MKVKLIFLLLAVLIFLQLSCGFCESIPSYIAIYGDNRTGHDIHREIIKAMMHYKPSVVFHTGDLVYNDPGDWVIFNEITSELRKNAEFYPVLGNHEYNVGIESFFENFELPNNEQWYSVERQGIHFIILDSNIPIVTVSDQHKWLKSDLQNIGEDIKFTVVIFHHPIFSSAGAINQMLRYMLGPLFEEYDVDIVFNGHVHAYERYFTDNIYYITTGGGGAPLYEQIYQRMYSQKFIETFHFCILYVKNNTLFVDVLDKDLNIIDQFSVNSAQNQ